MKVSIISVIASIACFSCVSGQLAAPSNPAAEIISAIVGTFVAGLFSAIGGLISEIQKVVDLVKILLSLVTELFGPVRSAFNTLANALGGLTNTATSLTENLSNAVTEYLIENVIPVFNSIINNINGASQPNQIKCINETLKNLDGSLSSTLFEIQKGVNASIAALKAENLQDDFVKSLEKAINMINLNPSDLVWMRLKFLFVSLIITLVYRF